MLFKMLFFSNFRHQFIIFLWITPPDRMCAVKINNPPLFSHPTPPNKKYQKTQQDSAYKSISPLYDPLKAFTPDRNKKERKRVHSSQLNVSLNSSLNSSLGSLSGMDLSWWGSIFEWKVKNEIVFFNEKKNKIVTPLPPDRTLTLSPIESHPKESNYESRYEAIKNDKSVLMYYSKSSKYKSLSRSEKDLVKRKVNEIKREKIR